MSLERLIYRISDLTALDNPIDYGIVRLLSIPRTLRFRNGFSYRATKKNLLEANTLVELAHMGVEFTEAERDPGASKWRVYANQNLLEFPSGIRVTLDLADSSVLAETFLFDTHFWGNDLAGCDVVDVGAYIGDTALYFASKGARVFAFEPDPLNYHALQRNLALNPGLSGSISTFNMAVGPDATIPFWAGRRSGSSAFAVSGNPVSVRSVSLKTVFEMLRLQSPFLLKTDCKGCETDLVKQSQIKDFAHVQIEYTKSRGRGNPEDIVRNLRALDFAHVRVYKHNLLPFPLSVHGMIRADRAQ